MMYLLSAFVLGLFSSLHCVGMCGPITVLLKQKTKQSGILPQYQIGRILGYTLLGFVFGFFGKGLSIAGVQQQLSIGLGIVMVISVVLPQVKRKSIQLERLLLPIHQKFKTIFSQQLSLHHKKNRFVIGMLNSLLPCGMIYIALIGALNAEQVWQGGLFMLLFGLGTLPLFSLFLIQLGSIKSPRFKIAMQKALPALVVLMGIALILRGAGLGFHFSPSFGDLSIASFKACFNPQ